MEKYGRILTCSSCKFCSKIDKNDVSKFETCKMIDHDKTKLYKKIHNGYESSMSTCPICYHFEPNDISIWLKETWSGIDGYIEELKTYEFNSDNKQYDKLKDIAYVTLVRTENNITFHYHVSLYDWLTNNVFNGDEINYMYKYKIETEHRYPKRVLVDDKKTNYFKEMGVL